MEVVLSFPRWYAVYTRSNYERVLSQELTLKGIETYLPAFKDTRQWKDRKKEVDFPLFPGYVFVRIPDSSAARLQVLRTTGTVRILGNGGDIEPVPDADIESVRCLLQSRFPLFRHPFLQRGARVRLKRGPLQGLEGILIREKNSCRVVVSIELLSQSVATEVTIGDVEVIYSRTQAACNMLQTV